MKKKIIFGIGACLFVFATVLSFNMSRQDNINDISLKNIVALTTANAEIPDGTNCSTSNKGLYCGTFTYGGATFYLYWQ